MLLASHGTASCFLLHHFLTQHTHQACQESLGWKPSMQGDWAYNTSKQESWVTLVGQFISPTCMQARRFRGDIVLNGNLAPVCCWCEKCKLSKKVILVGLVHDASCCSLSPLHIINGGPALLCIKHAMSETIWTYEPTTTNTTHHLQAQQSITK